MKEADPYKFIPEDTAVIAEFDLIELWRNATVKRLVETRLKKNDCLKSLLAKKFRKIIVGWNGIKSNPPFGIVLCEGCNRDEIFFCLKDHFNVSFKEREVEKIGGIEFFVSHTQPQLYLYDNKKTIFFVGCRKDAERLSKIAQKSENSHSRRNLFNSEGMENLNSIAFRIFVRNMKSFCELTQSDSNEIGDLCSGFKNWVAYLKLIDNRFYLHAKLKVANDLSSHQVNAMVKRLREDLNVAISNPVVNKIGADRFLKKVIIESDINKNVIFNFSITGGEIEEFFNSSKGVLKLTF